MWCCVTLLIEMFPFDIHKLPCCCTYLLPQGLGWKFQGNLCQLYDTPANRPMMDQPRKEKSSFLSPSYAGLLSIASQFRMYKFECF